jgi:hypothetical protein
MNAKRSVPPDLLAAVVNSTFVAGENLTVGGLKAAG